MASTSPTADPVLPSAPNQGRLSPRLWALLAFVVVVVIYVARIGAAGPWDPWETHYGEVARQIAVRHDPLDLWWQPGLEGPDAKVEQSFASKPALPFWLMALSFRLFDVGWSSDPAEMVGALLPVLALRLPSLLAGLLSVGVLGFTVWRLVSWRAGIFVALVLATMPQWAMVTRQALTDMFFVGPVVWALCAWLLAFALPERALKRRAIRRVTVPWDRAYGLFFACLVIGALVPLAALHQHSFDPYAWNRYGNVPRYAEGLKAIQLHLLGYWLLAIVLVVRSLRWRSLHEPLMGIVYICAGLSLMGKGLIGPGLVGAVVFVDLVVSGRWQRLRRAGLPSGIGLFVLSSFPWHHAMVLYRGERWVNELIIQNNLQRFGTGEQDQAVGGLGFYLETLGLAALPWVALVPVALWFGLQAYRPGHRGSDGRAETEGRERVVRFALLWTAVTWWALSYSVTKYYHYLLPLLPPLAVLVGVWMNEQTTSAQTGRASKLVGAVLGLAIVVGIIRDAIYEPEWFAHLTTYLYTGIWSEGAPPVNILWLMALPFVLGLVLYALPFDRQRLRALAVGGWLLGGVCTTGYILNDYLPAASESWSQRSALRTYFAQRGPNDKLVSWWFYYRGETFLTKGRVWMMKDPDPKALAQLISEMSSRFPEGGTSVWFITTNPHATRLAGQLPANVRDNLQVAYQSAHYTLMRLPLP